MAFAYLDQPLPAVRTAAGGGPGLVGAWGLALGFLAFYALPRPFLCRFCSHPLRCRLSRRSRDKPLLGAGSFAMLLSPRTRSFTMCPRVLIGIARCRLFVSHCGALDSLAKAVMLALGFGGRKSTEGKAWRGRLAVLRSPARRGCRRCWGPTLLPVAGLPGLQAARNSRIGYCRLHAHPWVRAGTPGREKQSKAIEPARRPAGGPSIPASSALQRPGNSTAPEPTRGRRRFDPHHRHGAPPPGPPPSTHRPGPRPAPAICALRTFARMPAWPAFG